MQNKIRVFIDTNIILTGTFFSGHEILLVRLAGVDLFTADVCLEEARRVTKRSSFEDDIEIAIEKLENTFIDVNIVNEVDYTYLIPTAALLIPKKKNDQKILAAALYTKPDYFVSRYSDFNRKEIKKILNLKTAEDVLTELDVI